MPTITDATVIAQAYDTSGNGGRKIAYLSNNWIVSVTKTTNYFYFYVDKRDGNGFVPLCYVYNSNIVAGNDIAIISKGTSVLAIYGYSTTAIHSVFFDASTVQNVDIYSSHGVVDITQSALGNVSLAINEAKTELHAAWASKNATYPNSFNIRYAKGTINADGTVTWGAVEQRTAVNASGLDIKNPSIIINSRELPVIICDYNNGTSANYIYAIRYSSYDGSSTTSIVYQSNGYAQLSPSAIYVPQSISGLANGLSAVAWHGVDTTNTTTNYIRFSKSTDGGVTWSTAQRLIVGTNASLTANRAGKLFITYEDAGVTKRIESTNNGDTWSSAITVGTGTNPSTLFDLNITMGTPLTIRKGTSSVLFSGSWTVTSISVTPGDIGQLTDKNALLTYSITTDGTMSTITEKINGTVVNTRTTTSGQAVKLGLTQAQWDAIRFGRYSNTTGGRNTLTIEMGTDKWTYTFDKHLATDADVLSAVKATKDANEVYLPSVKKQLADAINAKGGSVSASADWMAMIAGIRGVSLGRKWASGTATASASSATFPGQTGTTTSSSFVILDTSLMGFTPSMIDITSNAEPFSTVWRKDNYFNNGSSYANCHHQSVFRVPFVNGAMYIPVRSGSMTYEWIAYE